MKKSTLFGLLIAFVALAIILSAAGTGWYVANTAAESGRLLKQAERAFHHGDYDTVIARTTAVLTRSVAKNSKAVAYGWRGAVKIHNNEFTEAIADLNEAIRLDPQFADAFAQRALAYQGIGDYNAALRDYNEAFRLGTRKDDKLYYNRGMVLASLGEYDKAIADLTEAIHRSPTSAAAFIARARAYAQAHNVDGAIASLESALQIEPENKEVRFLWEGLRDPARRGGMLAGANENYSPPATAQGSPVQPAQRSPVATAVAKASELMTQAILEAQRGKLDEAISALNALLKMDLPLTTVSTACQNRGNAYLQKGEENKALEDYERAIRFNPSNGGAYVCRGMILAKRGEHSDAIKDYKEAIRLEPKTYQAYFNRALSYRDEGNLELAEDDFNKVVQLRPELTVARIHRAGIYGRQGKYEKALADYDAALRADNSIPEAYLGRAEIYRRKKSYSRAVAELKKLTQQPLKRPAIAFNSLAWLRATCPDKSQRNADEAVELALKACELTYWQEWGYIDTLAAAYAENREFDRAADFQRMALDLCKPATKNRGEAEQRLTMYQARKPYRDTQTDSAPTD